MGDRAMANIKTSHGSIYVYTHWRGSELPQIAKSAILAAKPRWGDESYATHIIIDQLTKDSRDSETGVGIMLVPDHEDAYNHDQPSVIVDLPLRTLIVQGHEHEDTQVSFSEIE